MGAAGLMILNVADMKRWIQMYTTGKISKSATYKALKSCVYTGEGNLYFGLALGCSAGWYGYTVGLQANTPSPGVANALFKALATIMTPNNVPFVKGGAPITSRSRSAPLY